MADSHPIQVLLATYNGQRFLQAQIDSIFAQTYRDVTILARDDGSTDETAAILHANASAHLGRLRQMPTGEPSGSAKDNFLRLMDASTAPYVALADQDDVWLPDKLECSMDAMQDLERRHGTTVPLLVFSDLAVVNESLQEVHPSFWAQQHIKPNRIHDLAPLLAQNVVTGCTALLNRALVERCLSMPQNVYMHDWWIALNACAFGHSSVLRRPTVLYRQHEHNVIGARTYPKPKLVPNWRNHGMRRIHWETRERQAEAMLQVHDAAIPPEKRRVLLDYVRCETSPSRLVRVFTWLRHGFFQTGLRPNLAMLWYLWDMAAAKRNTGVSS